MKLEISTYLAVACQYAHLALAAKEPKTATITSDVAIIGGGSAGTYTAIQLQKLGKTVTLIETLGQLGGNVNTYRDPKTGETHDTGVVAYEPLPVVRDYLKYLNISYVVPKYGPSTTKYANFKTGSSVSATKVASGNLTAALEQYEAQLHKYPYLTNGFDLPSTIPPDFFLSWGDFIKKYDLHALAYTVSTYNQGIGNILDQPTLFMFKYLDQGELGQLLTGVSLASASNGNQEIYDKALAKLGSSAFVSSNVTSVKRSVKGVELAVTTPHGKKLIKSRKLVVAVRPTLAALDPFLDTRADEMALFKQWNSSYYYCGLVANTGLPANLSVNNADPSQPYLIPASPGLYGIGATSLSSGLHTVYYSSPYNQSTPAVQAEILATIQRVREGLGYPAPYGKPSIAYWRVHSPFFLTVSEDAVRNGFYSKLEGLQGKYDTYWTGAAWQTEDSSAIWNYTRAVTIPSIMKGLA